MVTKSSTAPSLLMDDSPTAAPAASSPVVRDVALVPAESANLVLMFERLAKDPAVDPAKLRELIDLQKDIVAFQAKAEFDAAFSEMQQHLPIIDEKGRISVDGQQRSTFARHEDIQEAVRPILAQFGFAIRHTNKRLENGSLLITAILSHRSGHRETDEFECPPDSSGKKNEIQAKGSTREYGRRYTTISILNITTRGVDDDGKSAGKTAAPEIPAPEGYVDWWNKLRASAEKGLKAFEPAWECSEPAFKTYAMNHDRDGVKELKVTAATAGKR